MSIKIIVSYDGTANDDDALALAKLLAQTGASLALAYVRHSREFDPGREELAEHDAQRRLGIGAAWLGDPEIPRHIVVSASTGEGLAKLAESEGASVIVFGSEYRTPPGRVEPGTSAQNLLEGGPVAIAVAPAGLRTRDDAAIKSIAVSAADADTAAKETADSLAEKLGGNIVADDGRPADLFVVGSQASAPPGRIALSGASRSRLNSAYGSVLVVPHGAPVVF
jgi:nucleotide-binding universal stress UspA family protein